MSNLSPSFLGQKVHLNDSKEFIIRYEEYGGKGKTNVLLFDQEAPVIFAVVDKDGQFIDSFYLSNKSTRTSTDALERFKKIQDRKKLHKVTQDDLRDALKPMNKAKMKNEHIMKLLVDEHLEDIKHQWPSRLLTLQNTIGKEENSLILSALDEALNLANGAKSLKFLVQHRYDSLVPKLGKFYEQHPQMLEDVTTYYLNFEHKDIVVDFLYEAVKNIRMENYDQIEDLLNLAKRVDHIYSTSTLRNVLSRLFKRVKSETDDSLSSWLKETIHDQALKQFIVDSLKKRTG